MLPLNLTGMLDFLARWKPNPSAFSSRSSGGIEFLVKTLGGRLLYLGISGVKHALRVSTVNPGVEPRESLCRREMPAFRFGDQQLPVAAFVAEDIGWVVLLVAGYQPLDGTENQIVIVSWIVFLTRGGIVAPVGEVDEDSWISEGRAERRVIGEVESHPWDVRRHGCVPVGSSSIDIPVLQCKVPNRVEFCGQFVAIGARRPNIGYTTGNADSDRPEHRSSGLMVWYHRCIAITWRSFVSFGSRRSDGVLGRPPALLGRAGKPYG